MNTYERNERHADYKVTLPRLSEKLEAPANNKSEDACRRVYRERGTWSFILAIHR